MLPSPDIETKLPLSNCVISLTLYLCPSGFSGALRIIISHLKSFLGSKNFIVQSLEQVAMRQSLRVIKSFIAT